MNISDLRDAPDTVSDLAAASLRAASDVSLPDISLPDALDIDIVDVAGNAVEFASDVAGVVVSRGGRLSGRALRAAWRNPKATLGVAAVVVLLIGMLAAKRSSPESTPEAVS